MRLRIMLAAAGLVSVALTHPVSAAPALGLHLAPCTQGRIKVPAQCGTFGVYEDRGANTGRVIELSVILLKAKHPTHHDVIAEIAGGPGESATDFAGFLLDGYLGKARVSLHDSYDFLFVDDRGMGKSNPFACDFTPAGNPASYFRELFPNKLVAKCRTKSVASHDLKDYNTQNAADDLNDVRAALGYRRLILDGGSYGTFLSLVYMRRHPDSVESAVLDGVSPPHFQPLPGEPMGAQSALDDLIGKCNSDAACKRNFPQFRDHFTAVLRRVGAGLRVPVQNPVTKRPQMVTLSKEVFVDQVRHVLYVPIASAFLPYIIERAYRSDYAPLGNMIQTVSLGFAGDLNMGAFLSYTCADWMPFLSPADVANARAHSFAGDLRIRAQRQACATWNVPAMPRAFNDAVRSTAPVLMILGSDDPATPPQYGERALRYLPNGKAVLVKGGGHGADTACTNAIMLQFIRQRSAKGLDVDKCTATFKLPPFATSMKGWP